MKKINKGNEPISVTKWKRLNSSKKYDELSENLRQDIRKACTEEQFYLCAYCCQRISGLNKDTMNEHVEARSKAPNRSLDFNNIVASCKTPKQCDSAHGSKNLPLTPLMEECETELNFLISGRVKGSTQRAIETIRVLNLGEKNDNKFLIDKRKQLCDVLLFKNGIDPGEGLDDDELIQEVIKDLCVPQDGKLEMFAPVVINMLRGWLSTNKVIEKK